MVTTVRPVFAGAIAAIGLFPYSNPTSTTSVFKNHQNQIFIQNQVVKYLHNVLRSLFWFCGGGGAGVGQDRIS